MLELAEQFVAEGCVGVFKNPEKETILRSFVGSDT